MLMAGSFVGVEFANYESGAQSVQKCSLGAKVTLRVLDLIRIGAEPRELSLPAVLSMMEELESFSRGDVMSTEYVVPGQLLGGDRDPPLLDNQRWDTGLVLINTVWGSIALEPPFPVLHRFQAEGASFGELRQILAHDRAVGVVLLRLGAFAVGVLKADRVVAYKAGKRYVRGRHRAGGQSQRRFERNREKWIMELFNKVCQACRDIIEPQSFDHLIFGGDRQVLLKFRRQCPRLGRFESRVLSRVVPVNRPDRDSLKRANRHIWASRVFVYKP